jgi:general secretion pathway protein I
MSNSTIRHTSAGFTLLEVLVAVAVASVALLAIYRLQAQTINMNYSIRFYATAPLLAQDALARFEAESLAEETGDAGDFGDEFPDYLWEISVDDVESELLEDVAENLKKINVTVTYNEDEFVFLYSTYRFVEG